jgi:hypothetical protein
MSLALGKRKRRQDVSRKDQNVNKDDGSDDDDATARALFQRAFEKKFKPLPKTEKPANQDDTPNSEDDDVDDDDDEDDDSEGSGSEDSKDEDDWSGISEGEEETTSKPQIEIVEDRTFSKPLSAEEKRLKKQFMTAKIPTSAPKYPIPHKPSATAPTKADPDGEGQDGTDNLQNDLALQRLLKESHLLDANTFAAGGSGSSAPEGAARLRALDMRIRDLGGKKSHMDQERMPIAFRKGMVAKAGQREDKRRTEAKENGIILERFGAKSAGGAGAATRGGGKERKRGGSALGIGGPDVGTYRGATLRLSKNDIKGIEGSSKRGGRGGRGGGRGGKRKGPAKFGSGV